MKVFIDCGGHFGEGFAEFQRHLNIDPSWKIIMFEPNKVSAQALREKHLPWWKNQKNIDIELRQEIAWSSDGVGTFMATTARGGGGPSNGVGSTAMPRANWNVPNAAEDYQVKTCDIAKLVLSFDSDDIIYLKLDVEGSEVEILERMIKTNAIDRVRHTWVEWHSRMFVDPKEYNSRKRDIRTEMKRRGTNCWDWR